MIQINGIKWSKLNGKDIESAISEIEESFFYEFKGDDTSNKKLVEEISAFANTYGGYIFLGVSDKKEIEGCKAWNEERITSVIHDSISPIPSFDIKKFTMRNKKTVLVVRIDEGSEPPYITNKGKIYERISSSSCEVTTSEKLTYLYTKRIDQQKVLENKISIKKIENKRLENIYGYIDLGFVLTLRNKRHFTSHFYELDIEKIVQQIDLNDKTTLSLSKIGDSIVLIYGGMCLKDDDGEEIGIQAHINSFAEFMPDGSTRLRVLLYNNYQENLTVNLVDTKLYLYVFEKVYKLIFEQLIEENFIYAKKYEELTVIKQFYPVYDCDEIFDEDMERQERKYKKMIENHISKTGKDIVITDDRIPKTGLLNIDRYTLERNNLDLTADNIIFLLFLSRFSYLGYIKETDTLNE